MAQRNMYGSRAKNGKITAMKRAESKVMHNELEVGGEYSSTMMRPTKYFWPVNVHESPNNEDRTTVTVVRHLVQMFL